MKGILYFLIGITALLTVFTAGMITTMLKASQVTSVSVSPNTPIYGNAISIAGSGDMSTDKIKLYLDAHIVVTATGSISWNSPILASGLHTAKIVDMYTYANAKTKFSVQKATPAINTTKLASFVYGQQANVIFNYSVNSLNQVPANVYVNDKFVSSGIKGSVILSASIGTYAVNVITTTTPNYTTATYNQVYTVYSNTGNSIPAFSVSVLRSFNYGQAGPIFNYSVTSLNNQITANVYINDVMVSNGASGSLTLNSAIGGYTVNVIAPGNANYITVSSSQFYEVYPNVTTLVPNVIKHVVFIMQENHAFDNYFGTYPGAVGFAPNLCSPNNIGNALKGCTKPFETTNTSQIDMAHSWNGSHKAIDNGLMDGFITSDLTPEAMSYYTNKTLPYYWSYAEHYTLQDMLFSSALSYSLPNHWYEISGNTPNIVLYDVLYPNTNSPVTNAILGWRQTYLNQSNLVPTLADELITKGISWKYYAFTIPGNYIKAQTSGMAYTYWNPLFAQNRSYSANYMGHFNPYTSILSDLANNALPAVSWVSPVQNISEHPPANVALGELYVTDIINHIENSTAWNSTMVVVMWDDYGGYYDGVLPPVVDANGLSFRVPGIVISPYSKANFVDNSIYSFESTMKFVEMNWNLNSLTYRDTNSLPMLNSLYFNQPPQKPYIIPLSADQLKVLKPLMHQAQPFQITPIVNVNGYNLSGSDFDT